MTGDQLRKSFIDFFVQRHHVELPSLPLIPQNDPSVLFVTAGMQQMIPFFLGLASPPSRRLCSVQKCIRTVDIEEVGDESHLTFFEMLGNFSVGDYFVPEAIAYTWEYLTKELGLPRDRLWATVYPGDELAHGNWIKVGIPIERIVEDPENWWTRAGLAGPAGPDSEVHYDRGIQYGCGRPDCNPVDGNPGCHRFVEIWNNVFMDSLVNEKNEVQQPLPSKNIDTGQGFERLLMVVQRVETVYETDVFAPIISSVANSVGRAYKQDESVDRSLRIIADHCRSLVMAMSDGAIPGNEGRGYVLRRLLRRAVLRGRLLGIERPFLSEPVTEVIRIQGAHYPNVRERGDEIVESIRLEEERFAETVTRGLPLFEELLVTAAGRGVVAGDRAFILHDTYGLPFELMQELADERGLTIDAAAFEAALTEQQQRGRAGRTTGQQQDLRNLATLFERVDATLFTGYTETESDARVQGIIVEGRLVDTATAGESVEVVLDRTPFYAESGGQVGDTGEIFGPAPREARVEIDDTQRPYAGIFIHKGTVRSGAISVGDQVTARIDSRRRARVRPHHSATHLLHLALHEILGPQATQAGSLVAPDRLRFDFRWSRPVTPEELEKIQDRINELVFENDPVVTREISYVDAIAEGAMALFGEKYGDVVRMVAMGTSKELCGGTHVTETVEVGPVVITAESGIGSGVRRIEALAGRAAYNHFRQSEIALKQAATAVGAQPERLLERVEEIDGRLRTAEKHVTQLSRRLSTLRAQELLSRARNLNGSDDSPKLIVDRVTVDSQDELLQLTSATLDRLGSGVVVVGSVIDDKPQFAAAVSGDLQARGYNARDIAQKVGQSVGGGAGGKPSFAQGGGRNSTQLDAGLQNAGEFVRSQGNA